MASNNKAFKKRKAAVPKAPALAAENAKTGGWTIRSAWKRTREEISRQPPTVLIAYAFLTYWICYAYVYLSATVHRAWFSSSDEYVLAAEVIRFSNLDFRQHFFDNPGSSFILLDAFLWRAFYGLQTMLGLSKDTGIGPFTFQHIVTLFAMMRTTTIVFLLLSVVLLFLLAKKLMNASAAAVAALLLTMSPLYAATSSLARTESMAMACMLGAMLLVIRANERVQDREMAAPRPHDSWMIAGILVGIAAAARLHSLSAAAPVLVMMIWAGRRFTETAYPRWVRASAWVILPAGWAVAGVLIERARTELGAMPGARGFVISGAVAWLAVSGGAVLLNWWPRTRTLIVRAISPGVIKLMVGIAIGEMAGNPMLIRQSRYFLDSVQMYSQYRDLDRAKWPFLVDVKWYFLHYMEVVANDKLTLLLLIAGTLAILAWRDRKMMPFLAAAWLFFVSKPLTLVASAHHIILWLPFFFLVCAYPVGKLLDWASVGVRYGKVLAPALLAIVLFGSFQLLSPGPRVAKVNVGGAEERMHSIELATAWIRQNAEPRATVAISYYCFNPDTFYVWLRSLEVPVPDEVFDGREHIIWWGNRSALRGKTGYACATRDDVPNMKTRLDLSSPGEGTDPYTAPGFQMVKAFRTGQAEVDVFRFDNRER
ncbi:MAG: hypothetical protein JWP63_6563 [Candidatus Solibacter sp.]|nr:hypothetical protein [Candidatus Solibacter sp.]